MWARVADGSIQEIIKSPKIITISGDGIDLSILSFKKQEDGAEGIKIINCKNMSLKIIVNI